jgi:hypothetical protein
MALRFRPRAGWTMVTLVILATSFAEAQTTSPALGSDKAPRELPSTQDSNIRDQKQPAAAEGKSVTSASSLPDNQPRGIFRWPWDNIAHVATVVGLLVTITLSYTERRRHNRLLTTQRLIDAQNKYDSICAVRTSNPELISIARSWRLPQPGKATRSEIAYQNYIELTLGFVETYVYLTFVEKSLSKRLFLEFIQPMLWLEVSYNLRAFRLYSHSRSISVESCAYLTELVSQIDAAAAADPMSPLTQPRSEEQIAKKRSEIRAALAAVRHGGVQSLEIPHAVQHADPPI